MWYTIFIGLLVAIVFNSLSTFAVKDDSSICCIKEEWEGLMFTEVEIAYPLPFSGGFIVLGINASVRVAFSLSRKKVYFNITSILGTPLNPDTPAPLDATYLYDFEKGISYMYTVQDDECKTEQLLTNLTRQCVPNDATMLSTGKFGDEGRHVTTYQFNHTYVSTWLVTAVVSKQGMYPHINCTITDLSPVQPTACDPISVTYSSPTYIDSGYLYSLQIMDIGPIQSTDVFDIPKPCRKTT